MQCGRRPCHHETSEVERKKERELSGSVCECFHRWNDLLISIVSRWYSERTRSDVAAKVVQGTCNILVLLYRVGSCWLYKGAERVDTVALAIALGCGASDGPRNGR